MTYQFVLPFLNQDENFTLGFESGMLYVTLGNNTETLDGYYHARNLGQLLLIASMTGHTVVRGEERDGWVWLEFTPV